MLPNTIEKAVGSLPTVVRSGRRVNGLFRLMKAPLLWELAYQKIAPNKGAMTPGVDGETFDGFSPEKVHSIISRLADGTYRPSPVRRVYIPKANGKKRPLGVPTTEDRLVQEVVRTLLEQIYEPLFSQHSHGFRPGRSCHTALEQIRAVWTGVKWLVDVDVVGFFDNIDHDVLLGLLEKRIADQRFIALLPTRASPLVAALWTALSRLTLTTGQTSKAFEIATRAVDCARESGDATALSYALAAYIYPAAFLLDFDKAVAALAEAEAVAPAQCIALRNLELNYARAVLWEFEGDLEAAARSYGELRAKEIALGNPSRAAAFSSNLAEIEHELQRTERAVAIIQEELPAIRASRSHALRLNALTNLAAYLIVLDRVTDSLAIACEALRFGAKHDPDNYNLTFAIEALALGFALQGRIERAARLAGYARTAQQRLGRDREYTERTTRDRLDSLLSEHLAPAVHAELVARGEAMTADEAFAFALHDDRE